MKGWRKRFVLMLIGLASSGLIIYSTIPRKPVYQGRSVGQWFEEYCEYPSTLGTKVTWSITPSGREFRTIRSSNPLVLSEVISNDPSMEALRALGSNTVPLLIEELAAKDTAMVKFYRTALSKAPRAFRRVLPNPIPAALRRMHAATVLGAMGDAGKKAIPALIEALKNEQTSLLSGLTSSAIRSLSFLHAGQEAFDSLIGGLVGQARYSELSYLLRDVNSTPLISAKALGAVLGCDDQQLRETAARRLKYMGRDAAPATAAIIRALSDPSAETRYQCVNALESLDPASHKAIPQLRKMSNDDESSLVRSGAARVLEKLASNANRNSNTDNTTPVESEKL